MQTLQPRVSGTRDYVGDEARSLQSGRNALETAFRRYGYASIDPPILERSAPFLDRSGEDIRRRMYIFPDPGGREICLRPELTISACRAYLRQLQAPEGEAQFSSEREARLCYVGPAFRYESTGEGRYRQFVQAGAELIGARHQEAADAEILAVALEALSGAGLTDAEVEIGDLSILHAFIDGLPIAERSKPRLRRLALRSRKEARLLSAVSAMDAATSEETVDLSELGSLLASIEPGKAELLIREVLALADVRHVGGRTSEEIVERLIARTAQESAESISREIMEGIWTLLSIRGSPALAFETVRDHFKAFQLPSIDPVLDRCRERLQLFAAYGYDRTPLELNVGLRRGLEYYTGFVFEIVSLASKEIGHLCGGGRYNNLLEALGANVSIPAVGFAIGVDRLLVALRKSQVDPPPESNGPDALVVAAGSVTQEECIRVSVSLRKAGWSVETETSGRRAKSALSYALKRKIPYLVFVGEDEIKNGQVSIKRLDDRNEQLVALKNLETYVKGEPSTERAGTST
jgi:ATP phosphoribosyltransferase regulatory subunit